MLYEYDEVGRVSKVTPPQGTNYRTQYTYKENGSVLQVKVYDAGSGADTDYTYNTTSGKLTQRNNPVVSAANVRTTYAYDSAGRVSDETVTREAGGTTNLYKTAYAYSYLTYGRQLIRTEQDYSGGMQACFLTGASPVLPNTFSSSEKLASIWLADHERLREVAARFGLA